MDQERNLRLAWHYRETEVQDANWRQAMICKLLLVAQKSWRALNTPRLMRDVYDG